MKIVIFLTFFHCIISASLVQLLGMEHLLEGMGRMKSVEYANGEESTLYTLEPSIYTFLKQFRSRTQFCDHRCQFFNLPCLMVFGCNIQLRNFSLLFVTPIILVVLIAICCRRGIWTCGCWLRYLAAFTGITLFIWLVRQCVKGSRLAESRRRQKQLTG